MGTSFSQKPETGGGILLQGFGSDRLIPFYLDELQLEYLGSNSHEGFAYGADLLLQGEIVEGVNSWIGYSYLNSKERSSDGSKAYQRRLLDQTHTLRLFVQDRIPQHPNVQTHLRFLLGSGFLFHPRQASIDPVRGDTTLAIDFSIRRDFQNYFRVDLGLSARFEIGHKGEIVVVGEVLNVFNHINVASYSWFQIFPGQPVRIPQIFTRRFFNVGLEVSF
ncbi:MAG: hypothetical protein GWN00_14065 [Aliifodinibius sp.]|nr:hypothetical protein [Fodinibius sp.]NIY25892.1 hypothetical protein [Fodinibius sp.]